MANQESALSLSWHDSSWIPVLNPNNVMDYFSERTNPFYDRTCNNEVVKMQRLSTDQLTNMQGIEYVLVGVQDPILYVIRKRHRHSPTQVTDLQDYYIIAGVVYQSPDLCTVINSRLLNTVHHIQSAFDEALSFSRYHPSKGYWWEFKNPEQNEMEKSKDKKRKKEEPSSAFQRQQVDNILGELSKKFPPKQFTQPQQAPPDKPPGTCGTASEDVKHEMKTEIKVEKLDENCSAQNSITNPPPEKKPKLMR